MNHFVEESRRLPTDMPRGNGRKKNKSSKKKPGKSSTTEIWRTAPQQKRHRRRWKDDMECVTKFVSVFTLSPCTEYFRVQAGTITIAMTDRLGKTRVRYTCLCLGHRSPELDMLLPFRSERRRDSGLGEHPAACTPCIQQGHRT